MKPRGSQPASRAVLRWRFGALRLFAISRHEPGPIGGRPLWRRNVAPAARSAVAAGRPSAPVSPSKESPFEWATMNHGGTPEASSAPIMLPADVPTTYSALAGSHPVCRAIASSPPVSQAPPMTPPAPSTRPTLTALPPRREVYDHVSDGARRNFPLRLGLFEHGGAREARGAGRGGCVGGVRGSVGGHVVVGTRWRSRRFVPVPRRRA